ncbi:leucine-rich_repeat domain-containing protein [Hexamita inflata]|uniref:Leucine-rich repeat domain-containing protein n=1 Tax=Hexamita inflata TaxID=28002 RepID=A0AA86PB59_9EUKA|nr:leucine-rich repeat domain-containing protein [Hexamita inflata]
MQDSMKQSNQENQNNNIYLSEYDKQMIEKYQSEIKGGILTIQQNPDLKSLNFINTLKINQLQLYECKHIVPQLDSQTIKELKTMDCKIQSVKDFQLENLEVLAIYNNQAKLESNTLAQEIVWFQKLKELTLFKYITDFSPLSQLIGLTKLNLWSCDLHCTEALRPLINLQDLCLNCNNIDITNVQYLTNLTILQLASCNLVNVDTLRPLKKLKSLSIYNNKIVYLQPLIELKQLSGLMADRNKIIDTDSIQQHPNFNHFDIGVQKQPTQDELKVANMIKDINSPITSLKQINEKSNHIKDKNTVFRKKITQQLQQSHNSHVQFVARVTLLFQKINVFDGCQ